MIFMGRFVLVILISLWSFSKCDLDFGYHNYDSLTSILRSYSSQYPNKTYLYSIGKSVQGRDIWVLAIADTQPQNHLVLRPEAKYVANIHGNEASSKETLLHLIDYMLTNQNSDMDVDYLMKNTRIHILPSLNPDGYEMSVLGDCDGTIGRNNSNNIDLSQNFPDLFKCNTSPIQPETQAIINWLESNNFILSASFHDGNTVISYPFDSYADANQNVSQYSASDDDDVFRNSALIYSFNHLSLRSSVCKNRTFVNGITNGAQWMPSNGGSQDFNYWAFGCEELTIELSCCKFPPPTQLNTIWNDNKRSLIEYLKLANSGVRGIIKYANGLPAQFVGVKIDQREPIFKTNQNGEYYRIILPGTHTLSVYFNCDQVYQTSFEVTTRLTEVNITLEDSIFQISQTYRLDKYPFFCQRQEQECAKSWRAIPGQTVQTSPSQPTPPPPAPTTTTTPTTPTTTSTTSTSTSTTTTTTTTTSTTTTSTITTSPTTSITTPSTTTISIATTKLSSIASTSQQITLSISPAIASSPSSSSIQPSNQGQLGSSQNPSQTTQMIPTTTTTTTSDSTRAKFFTNTYFIMLFAFIYFYYFIF